MSENQITKTQKKNPPTRPKNEDQRPREFITPTELDRLVEAARSTGRNGDRDALLINMAYKHALRAGELTRLKWSAIDLDNKVIEIKRLKGGTLCKHSLDIYETGQLKELRNQEPGAEYVFCSERRGALTSRAVHTIVARAGTTAGISFPIHPQMLCAGRSFQLVLEGCEPKELQAYLGHKSPRIADSYFRKIEQYLGYVKRHSVYLDKGIPVVNFSHVDQARAGEDAIEHSITVDIPGSTCNLGPGLDAIGLALNMNTRLTFKLFNEAKTKAPLVNLSGAMAKRSQVEEHNNLIYTILSKVWQYEPDTLNRMQIDIKSDIPLGCGLGASGTAVLGAIWASHVFQGNLPSCKTLLKECSSIEAHPETTAASILGGMVLVGSQSDDKNEDCLVHHIKWPIDWRVIIAVPPYSLQTKEARRVIPTSYSRKDVIHNIQRTALMVSAVYDHDEELMKEAMDDKIHEPYRHELVPELAQIKALLKDQPVIGSVLSGGGSSVAVFVNLMDKDQVLEVLRDWVKRENNGVSLLDLEVSKYGMREIVHI